ncbi:MAG: hypothetical protein PHW73_13125 [Atribacterota bacterium]|nr:hypothetical protein [Atribacterota bacterium]
MSKRPKTGYQKCIKKKRHGKDHFPSKRAWKEAVRACKAKTKGKSKTMRKSRKTKKTRATRSRKGRAVTRIVCKVA